MRSFSGWGGYLLGLLLQYTDLSPDVGFALGVGGVLAACAVIGLGVGLISLRLRGVYFAIFTLAVAEMVWIYFGRLPLTNGEDGFALSRLPAWIDPSMSRLNLYYVGLALFAFTFWLIRRMVRSPLGTVWVGDARKRGTGADAGLQHAGVQTGSDRRRGDAGGHGRHFTQRAG